MEGPLIPRAGALGVRPELGYGPKPLTLTEPYSEADSSAGSRVSVSWYSLIETLFFPGQGHGPGVRVLGGKG